MRQLTLNRLKTKLQPSLACSVACSLVPVSYCRTGILFAPHWQQSGKWEQAWFCNSTLCSTWQGYLIVRLEENRPFCGPITTHHYLPVIAYNNVFEINSPLLLLYPSRECIFTQTVWLSKCCCAFKVQFFFSFIYFRGNVRSRCSWHSVELTRSEASKTCLSSVGRCKPQWCLSRLVSKRWCIMQQRWSGSCCVRNQYVALTGYVAQPWGGFKDSTFCLNPLSQIYSVWSGCSTERCALSYIYLLPCWTTSQPHGIMKK